MKRVGLVGKGDIEHVRFCAKDIAKICLEHGMEVRFEASLAGSMDEESYPIETMDGWADFLITVGGDGTILYALHHSKLPVFGVNAGAIGFLAEVEPEQFEEAIGRVLEGSYTIEERAKLSVQIGDEELPDAINEVTLQTSRIAKLIRFEVRVNGQILETYRGDGMILSTPTGSTGYAMSVGGPLVHPAVGGFILAPIAPFKLASRPWVIPNDAVVEVKLLPRDSAQGRQQARAVVDGQFGVDVATEAVMTIRQSPHQARFVRLGEGFYDRVRNKLTR